nr:LacI family DNA-binding transcriptional regulator [Streptomyces graminofaciens]
MREATRATGVSPSTVSRALAPAGTVGPVIRERVQGRRRPARLPAEPGRPRPPGDRGNFHHARSHGAVECSVIFR